MPPASVSTLLGFTARPFDTDTGLQNNLNRWYDAETGTWISVDPMGFAAADVNLYRYICNYSTVFIDPTGLAKPPLKLPSDPSGLGPEWKHDPTHRDPNGDRFRDGDDYLDFHHGRPGQPGYKGKDHWHYNGGKEHLKPGTEIARKVVGGTLMVIGTAMVAVGAGGSGVLVADDLSIVGVADDPLLIVTGAITGIGGLIIWLGGS